MERGIQPNLPAGIAIPRFSDCEPCRADLSRRNQMKAEASRRRVRVSRSCQWRADALVVVVCKCHRINGDRAGSCPIVEGGGKHDGWNFNRRLSRVFVEIMSLTNNCAGRARHSVRAVLLQPSGAHPAMAGRPTTLFAKGMIPFFPHSFVDTRSTFVIVPARVCGILPRVKNPTANH